MKIAAHSMGTPHLTPFEAVDLFASMGYEGVEFVSREGHISGPTVDWSQPERTRLRDYCLLKGMPVVCLALYVTDLNSDDYEKAAAEYQLLRDSLILARDIGAPIVRLYGGRQVPTERWEGSIRLLAERLRMVVGLCRELGVCIAVENHFGTLTVTAAETMALINAIGAPEVAVLYDQANITYEGGEECPQAIDLQVPHILHVHAKDLQYLEGATESDASAVTHLSKERRTGKWVVLGRGIVPWGEILQKLESVGYDGYVSVEYTYKKEYEGDLPAPETGMKECLGFLKGLLRTN